MVGMRALREGFRYTALRDVTRIWLTFNERKTASSY